MRGHLANMNVDKMFRVMQSPVRLTILSQINSPLKTMLSNKPALNTLNTQELNCSLILRNTREGDK